MAFLRESAMTSQRVRELGRRLWLPVTRFFVRVSVPQVSLEVLCSKACGFLTVRRLLLHHVRFTLSGPALQCLGWWRWWMRRRHSVDAAQKSVV